VNREAGRERIVERGEARRFVTIETVIGDLDY